MTMILDKLFGKGETDDAQTDRGTKELSKVTWTETVEKEYTIVTETLVWPSGAEKRVTYCEENSWAMQDYYTIDGEEVIYVNNPPAFTEDRDERTITQEETERQTAWIHGDIPEGVEETGETTTVFVE